MRAYYDNVTANSYQIGTVLSWNESRSLNLSTNQMGFSDGNQRNVIDASWLEGWISGPVYKLHSILEYYSSRNSSQSLLINYFNPINDRYVGLTLQNEWLQFQRFDQSLKHIVRVGAGNYIQDTFGSGPVINIQYEQSYKRNDRIEFHYGLGHTEHPYDGANVVANYITFGSNWIF
jgi:biofilm PGA synthesis protein PgaA